MIKRRKKLNKKSLSRLRKILRHFWKHKGKYGYPAAFFGGTIWGGKVVWDASHYNPKGKKVDKISDDMNRLLNNTKQRR